MDEITNTRPHYLMFSEVIARHGARASELAVACGTAPNRARLILKHLIGAGLVEKAGALYFASPGGVAYMADHNNIPVQEMKGLLTLAPRPGQPPSTVRTKRTTAIGEVRTRFNRAGFQVFDGRRMGVGLPTDKSQWCPDLWVRIPAGARKLVWHAVVVDPSTQADSGILEMLRGYRRAARRDRDERPLLMVCRDNAAAHRFEESGDDLLMMVTTFRECLTGPFYGSGSVWRAWGRVADIDFLSRQVSPN